MTPPYDIEEGALCSVCQQLDFDAIFVHGISEKSSLAEDGHVSSDSSLDMSLPGAEVRSKGESDQPSGETGPLVVDDVREMADLESPAIDIGYLDDIMLKGKQCLFCYLVSTLALHSYSSLFRIPSTTGIEGEEVDTEDDDLEFVDSSDRLRCYLLTFPADELRDFRTQDDGKSAKYIEVQFRDRHGQKLPRRHHLLQDAKDAKVECVGISSTRSQSQTSFHNARPLKEGQADIELIKSWKDFCGNSHTHPNCALGSRAPASPDTSFRLIDVHNRRVVDAPPSCGYIALSYVWGRSTVEGQNTGQHNLLHVSHPHSRKLPATLPATIEDALTLVKQLGESFLWVDSLCIDQASAVDMASQVGIMDKIYGNALLTIIAAHASDLEAGLLGVQPDSRDPEGQTWAEIKGRRIYVSLPSLEQELENGAWMSRGWTYQEGLLSPRCLIFTTSQVFWKCSTELLSEGIAETDPSQRMFPKIPGYFEIFSSPLLYLGGDLQEGNDDSRTSVPFQNPYLEYVVHVEEYTSRLLTYESDKIPAFKGISNVLEERFQTELFWGLPESVFDLALLWRPVDMWENAEGRAPGVPTWSWASWPGHIRYTREVDAEYIEPETHAQPLHEYRKEDVEGRFSIIAQHAEPTKEERRNKADLDTESKGQGRRSKAYTQFLHFETESARLPLYPTPDAQRYCLHSVPAPTSGSEEWTLPDVGESIYIDNFYDDRLSQHLRDVPGREWEFILLSTWDESHAIGWGEPAYERYKEPVYNVLMVEQRGDVAYRIGMGHVKVSIWKEAGAIRKKIKLG